MSDRQYIKIGHTNKIKYKEDDTFVMIKTKNGFNHRIDYSVLKNFDFVPELIKEDDEKLVWQWIDGEMLTNPTDDDLKQVAQILRILHKSDISLPSNNFKKRYTEYIKEGHALGRRWPEIEDNWKEMQGLMSKMKKINPCHNDVWYENLIKDKDGKIWLVDWEYSTMGDKHFDLSFFMESSKLNEEQRDIFLKEYDSFDDYQSYFEEYIRNWNRFANWLTLCWAYGQEKEPFPLGWIKQNIKNTNK